MQVGSSIASVAIAIAVAHVRLWVPHLEQLVHVLGGLGAQVLGPCEQPAHQQLLLLLLGSVCAWARVGLNCLG